MKNFPETNVSCKNIETLTIHDIPKSDIWLISPPCQPFTKGGSNKDSNDNRTKPFLKLIELMYEIGDKAPKAWFIENVINFEISNTHNIMMNMLNKLNFVVFEFLITPTLIGIPNTRVRYYCLAIRDNIINTGHSINILMNQCVKNCKKNLYHKFQDYNAYRLLSGNDNIKSEYNNIICYLPFSENKCNFILDHYCNKPTLIKDIIRDFSINEINELVNLSINIIESNPSFKFDIVNKYSKVSTTFVKSYIKTKGRGGPLLNFSNNIEHSNFNYNINIYDHIFNTSTIEPHRFQKINNLSNIKIRCFHPTEILLIMGFPDDWFNDTDLTLLQQYSLIGNSISVYIVTIIFYFFFEIMEEISNVK
ncbi:DNA (cytosine-5)-methyltransferase domain-containing protein [Cryptosporidium ryanae]|uniref:DNA (cytosine-5)-methyltransferase domain-containing protein n=1 Tax=Cryptosporidium ryanae TaxID=515981 RepID=UPI00351A5F90|nr:DNA (cytosine-5)-methyltransferase domain-containing protein [Cryptosporidium ryanae]